MMPIDNLTPLAEEARLERIANRFDVEEMIGSGGMATVWRGTDNELGRRVAIKRLHAHLAGQWDAAERFKHEALAAASLSHPGVVTIFDAGEDEQGPYMVMELVEGETLSQLLRRERQLSPTRASEIAAQVAGALEHAHRRRLIHRDVKPSNILIDRAGQAKLGDFGIARSLEATHGLTMTGAVVGTAAYLAPERASGQGATAASDIYSLGVVLYEMLTGRVPFTAESPVAVAVAHQTSDPEPPSRVVAVPPDLEAIVMRALSKDQKRRFGSAAEMEERLSTWLTPLTLDQAPNDQNDATDTAPTTRLQARERSTAVIPGSPNRRVSRFLPAIAIMLVVGALVAGFLRLSASQGNSKVTFTSTTVAASITMTSTTTLGSTTSLASTTSVASTQVMSATKTSGFGIKTKPITVEDSFHRLQELLNEGVEAGSIERREWNELRKLVDDALAEWEKGDLERAAEKLDDFQRKLDDALEKGEIDQGEVVRELYEQISEIRRLAGPLRPRGRLIRGILPLKKLPKNQICPVNAPER